MPITPAVVLASATGLRQGELFGITESKIQWVGREIRIDQQLISDNDGSIRFGPPKSKRSVRDVPVADHAMKALADHVERYGFGPDGLLFRSTKDTPVRRNTASTSFRRIAEAAEVEASGWHSLRHHAASVLINGGLSVTAVAAVLGHSPAECLKTYAHWWPGENEKIRTAVAQAWAVADSSRTLRVVK